MIKPALPTNEAERVSSVRQYHLLDTLPESDYDNIARIASEICKVPMSLITILDAERQFFKSKIGLDGTQTPREHSFCGHAILNPEEIMVIRDSSQDERFYDNPLVTGEPHGPT